MRKDKECGIIISGQPRSGKSTLANVFSKNTDFNVLKTDILFIKHLKNKIFFANSSIMVEKFLNSFRYQDSKKKIKRYVKDDIAIDKAKIIEYVRTKNTYTQCHLIFSVLDAWNYLKKKKVWIVPDLNTEIYFHELVKIKPNTKFIFIFRNPIESIVASLYWRKGKTYPSNLDLVKLIIRWNLTFFLANKLKDKYKKSIQILFFESLEKNKIIDLSQIELANYKIKFPYKRDKTYFSYNMKKGWFTPKKKWEILLSNFQLNLINYGIFTKKYKHLISFNFLSLPYLFLIHAFSLIFISIALLSPKVYKMTIDFLFSPILSIKNMLRNI